METTHWNIRGIPIDLPERVRIAAKERGMTVGGFVKLACEVALSPGPDAHDPAELADLAALRANVDELKEELRRLLPTVKQHHALMIEKGWIDEEIERPDYDEELYELAKASNPDGIPS
ncbi:MULTISPECIES: hypothetical protein [unclassified Inquilinus]|uniref:hypothetical protein n=1 Tax=unclassified Inquilinus TaxID=2645927 RepID=UPI003F8E9161